MPSLFVATRSSVCTIRERFLVFRAIVSPMPRRLLLVVTLLAARTWGASLPREYLASMRPSVELQAFLDATVASLGAKDRNIGRNNFRLALVDLGSGDPPRLAHHDGDIPVYPASVIKFVYL